MALSRSKCIDYLENYWKKQQAVGKVAEHSFEKLMNQNNVDFISDVMLLQPKPEEEDNFDGWRNIHCFILDDARDEETSRNVRKASSFLESSGLSVIIPKVADEEFEGEYIEDGQDPDLDTIDNNLKWKWRTIEGSNTELVDIEERIENWRTGGYAREPDDDFRDTLENVLAELEDSEIYSLYLREHFFAGHIKSQHSITGDIKDVDGLIMPDDGQPVPFEMKEKSVYTGNEAPQFGLDVSRLIVLLRLSQHTDVDPVFIVKEVEEAEEYHTFERDLVEWWSIRVSDIIRYSALQIQRGGPGMAGMSTQTIMIPKKEFKEFEPQNFLSE